MKFINKIKCFFGFHYWLDETGYSCTIEFNWRDGIFEECLDCGKLRVTRV